jgi:hypothetical protein
MEESEISEQASDLAVKEIGYESEDLVLLVQGAVVNAVMNFWSP